VVSCKFLLTFALRCDISR